MGWGDYIMASGNVRRIKKSNPKLQVFINNPFNKTFYYENVFKSNPYEHSRVILIKISLYWNK